MPNFVRSKIYLATAICLLSCRGKHGTSPEVVPSPNSELAKPGVPAADVPTDNRASIPPLALNKIIPNENGYFAQTDMQTGYLKLSVVGIGVCKLLTDNLPANPSVVRLSSLAGDLQAPFFYNSESKNLTVSCSNDFGETANGSVALAVKKSTRIISFRASPPVTNVESGDVLPKTVTLSWTVDNPEKCSIQYFSSTSNPPIKTVSINPSETSKTLPLEHFGTTYALTCTDSAGHREYQEVRALVQSGVFNKSEYNRNIVTLYSEGYDKCQVLIPKINFTSWVYRYSSEKVMGTVTVPSFTRAEDILVKCLDNETGDEDVKKPSNHLFDEALVLRNATDNGRSANFEAFWNINGDRGSCNLINASTEGTRVVVQSNIPYSGTTRLTAAFDPMVRIEIECSNGLSKSLLDATLVSTASACLHAKERANAYYLLPFANGIKAKNCNEITQEMIDSKSVDLRNFVTGSYFSYMNNVENIQNYSASGRISQVNDLASIKKFKFFLEGSSDYWMHMLPFAPTLDEVSLSDRSLEAQDLSKIFPKLTKLTSNASRVYHLDEALASMNLTELHLINSNIEGGLFNNFPKLPLRNLSLVNISCNKDRVAGSCIKKTEETIANFPLTELSVDSGNGHYLQFYYNPSNVKKINYFATTLGGGLGIDWKLHTALNDITIEGFNSLVAFGNEINLPFKSIVIQKPERELSSQPNGMFNLSGINRTLPQLEEITLRNLRFESLEKLWELTKLKNVTLVNCAIESWGVTKAFELRNLTLIATKAPAVPTKLKVNRITDLEK